MYFLIKEIFKGNDQEGFCLVEAVDENDCKRIWEEHYYTHEIAHNVYEIGNITKITEHEFDVLSKFNNILENNMNYYLVEEEGLSGGDKSTSLYITIAHSMEDAKAHWRGLYDINGDEYETTSGNIFRFISAINIPIKEFDAFNGFLSYIGD